MGPSLLEKAKLQRIYYLARIEKAKRSMALSEDDPVACDHYKRIAEGYEQLVRRLQPQALH